MGTCRTAAFVTICVAACTSQSGSPQMRGTEPAPTPEAPAAKDDPPPAPAIDAASAPTITADTVHDAGGADETGAAGAATAVGPVARPAEDKTPRRSTSEVIVFYGKGSRSKLKIHSASTEKRVVTGARCRSCNGTHTVYQLDARAERGPFRQVSIDLDASNSSYQRFTVGSSGYPGTLSVSVADSSKSHFLSGGILALDRSVGASGDQFNGEITFARGYRIGKRVITRIAFSAKAKVSKP